MGALQESGARGEEPHFGRVLQGVWLFEKLRDPQTGSAPKFGKEKTRKEAHLRCGFRESAVASLAGDAPNLLEEDGGGLSILARA